MVLGINMGMIRRFPGACIALFLIPCLAVQGILGSVRPPMIVPRFWLHGCRITSLKHERNAGSTSTGTI